MQLMSRTAGRPNKPMHPTPLCGPKIAAILKAGFSSTPFPIYLGGAGDGQAVRRPGHVVGTPFLV